MPKTKSFKLLPSLVLGSFLAMASLTGCSLKNDSEPIVKQTVVKENHRPDSLGKTKAESKTKKDKEKKKVTAYAKNEPVAI